MGKVLTKKAESWRSTITRLLIFASTLAVLVITFSSKLPSNIHDYSRIMIIACLILSFLSICFGFFSLNKLTEIEGTNVYLEENFPNERGPYGQELVEASNKAAKSFNRFQVLRRIQLWTFIFAILLIISSSILFVIGDFLLR